MATPFTNWYRLMEFDEDKKETTTAEPNFPAQIHDAKAAIRWLRANAEKYNVDPGRIGVTGGSAGGHLSLLIGLTDSESHLEGDGGNPDQSSRVRAVVNFFGPTEMASCHDQSSVAWIFRLFMGGTPDEVPEVYKTASPINYLSRVAPPVLTLHGDQDALVPVAQAKMLDEKMKKAGADHTLMVFEGQLYSQLALHPQQDFGWLKGKENAKNLGYDQKWLDQVPDAVWESAAAVGNPFFIGPIHFGETVVDLGCGAGTDLCIAALMVGNTGRVFGIDLTPAMVEKARSNIELMHLANAQVELGDFLNLPLEDNNVDVVISNGTINLSPKQACVFREIMRVLKPNGRLYLADMIRLDNPPTAKCGSESPTQSWANCVAGTVTKDCLEKLLVDAGFHDVAFIGTTGYHTSPETEGALFLARKPAV